MIRLSAGTLKRAVITVSISLVCESDHPGLLPEPDSARVAKRALLIRV